MSLHSTQQEAFDECHKAMIARQGNYNKGNPACYALVHNYNGDKKQFRVDSQYNDVCHARVTDWGRTYRYTYYLNTHEPLNTAPCKDGIAVFNGLGTYSSVEKTKPFFECIFDKKKSPWRNVLQNSELLYEGKHQLPYAIRIDSPGDLNAATLVNLFIAARIPIEHPDSLNTWHKLKAEGLNDTQALYCLSAFQLDDKNNITNAPQGHYPFDYPNYIPYGRFVNGIPNENANQKFNKECNYYPCNVIWTSKGISLHSRLSQVGKYQGVFSKAIQKHYLSYNIKAESNNELYFKAVLPGYKEVVQRLRDEAAVIFDEGVK